MAKGLEVERLEAYVAPGRRGQRAGLGLAGKQTLLTEVPIVGWAAFSKAQQFKLRPHTHDSYEITCLMRGSSEWWVGNSTYAVNPRNIYLTRPGERHGWVSSVISRSEHCWIQVQFPSEKPLPGMSMSDTESLRRDLDSMRDRCFAASNNIPVCFSRILKEHRSPTLYSVMVARAALHSLLVQVIRDYSTHMRRLKLGPSTPSPLIQEAMMRIDNWQAEPLSVPALARTFGMSSSRFHELFLREIGWTPLEYRARSRVQRGQQMLRETHLTITQIALELGFSTSQYFATAFKNLTGLTPGEYRAQWSQESASLE